MEALYEQFVDKMAKAMEAKIKVMVDSEVSKRLDGIDGSGRS